MTVHIVESTTQTVRSGFLDPTASAVASVQPADVVSYPDTWTHWGNEATFGMTFAEREPLRHRYPSGPYSMIGPVEIAGAEPGDTVECRLAALRTRDWGWNSFPLGVGALPHDFAEPYVHYFRFDDARRATEYVAGITLTLAPFLGVMGVEPAGDSPVSAILAGPYGGNLVLRELTVGSSLFLPVAKPGARVWVGDVHALQGDGVRRPPRTSRSATTFTKTSPSPRRWARHPPIGSVLASARLWTTPWWPACASSSLGSTPPQASPKARPTPCAAWL
jgi:acetamidase/formamidase